MPPLTEPVALASGPTRLVVGKPTPQSDPFCGMIVICTVLLPLPPGPVQLNVYA
jgi:hypothetical protein